jgi:hypothetical protein
VTQVLKPTLEPLASHADLQPVSVPTSLIHGTLEPVRMIAQKLFTK